MIRNIKIALALAALALAVGSLQKVHAQETERQDPGNRYLPRQRAQDFRRAPPSTRRKTASWFFA